MEHTARRSLAADGALALVLAAAALAGTDQAGAWQGAHRRLDALGMVLIATATLPLALRRRWPLPVLCASTAATAGYLLLAYPYGPVLFGFAVAIYTVAAWLPARPATVAASVALTALLSHTALSGNWTGLVPGSAWVVVPFAVGRVVRVGRESAARARAEDARRHAYEARLHVAQEVHDIVGHGLAAIHMQAEIALHLLPAKPEHAETALTTISRTSKEALDELRATLAVVRRGGALPGLAALPDLTARLESAGLPITVAVQGRQRPLPSTVDLAAYRVLQEALTNVLRHAGPATAEVRLGYGEAALTVDVVDTGTDGTESTVDAGQGIAGMRDRVTALGGEFSAGPRLGGGFHVHARIPLTDNGSGK